VLRYVFVRARRACREMIGALFALAFATLLGVASIFSRKGLETGSFYALVVVSLGVASPIFLLITFFTTGFADAPFEGLAYAAVGGVVGSVVGRSLYFLGITYLGPGKSLSITATAPLYAAVFAWLFLDETITPLVVAGTVSVVLGIAVLSRDVRAQTERAGHSIFVALYPLVGAIFAAVAVILRKLALETGIAPVEAATVNMVAGFVVAVAVVVTPWRSKIVDVDRTALGYFVAASTIMAVGFLFYFYGLRVTNASVFFPLVQTQPLFAVVLSGVFLRRLEVVTRWTLLGSCVIVGGVALVVIG